MHFPIHFFLKGGGAFIREGAFNRINTVCCICATLPGKCDLERLVASDEGSQPGEGLFAGPAHSDEEGVAAWRTDDP